MNFVYSILRYVSNLMTGNSQYSDVKVIVTGLDGGIMTEVKDSPAKKRTILKV